jgi:hypothetical protein
MIMKKYLLNILLILLLPTGACGANWFAGSGDTDFNAVSGGTTSSVWNSNADGTSGTYLDFSTQPGNGDIFIANGATIAIDDNIGSGSVTVTLTTEGTDYGGTDGGGFSVAINTVDPLTLYTNIVAGSTDCLVTSGAGAGAATTELTINGNLTGGTSTGVDAIQTGHTNGLLVINGNVGVSTGNARGLYMSGTGGAVVNGSCTGSDSYPSYAACDASSSVITVTGNLINGTKGVAVAGRIQWHPSDATKYIKFNGGGTVWYAGISAGCTYSDCSGGAGATASGTNFLNNTDGTMDAGSVTAGSGGASAW